MTHDHLHSILTAALLWALVSASPGCSEPPDRPADDRTRARPLQPLVYTEDPDHSPEAAAVRDRRLMRQLLHASDRRGSWGQLESQSPDERLSLDSPETLGRAIYRAMVERDDRAWDQMFVTPRSYASLVQIELEKARRFVDDQQADAHRARQAFRIEKRSEAPREGLASIFTFEGLELGDGRTADGDRVGDDDRIVQHWDNRLRLGLAGEEVEFELSIRKILRIHLPDAEGGSSVRLGVASDIDLGSRLAVFLESGMHLKPALLRSFDYPIPLEVGNYWRYSRRLAGTDDEPEPEADRAPAPDPTGLPEELGASGVTVRVESVDRYDTRRLVHLRFVYNDADLTRRDEFWLITPRRVFHCPKPCRRKIADLEWLLGYLRRQTALFRFPIARGSAWGGTDRDPAFRVADQWQTIDVPGGTFFGTLAIDGLGPLAARVPFHRIRNATRLFSPGKGIVRRTYRIGGPKTETIVESLVDYRIMPR